MESLMTLLIVFGLVALVITIFAVSKHLEKKRTQAIQELAGELGLTFVSEGNGELQNRLKRFDFFNQGRDQRMSNLIWADSGEVKLSIFDYRFTTGSGKSTVVHKSTIAVMESQQLKLPMFKLRPESLLDKIGGALGFQDIDFESHPVFSRSFVLQGTDESAVRKMFQPKVLEFFEGLAGATIQGGPELIFLYRARNYAKVNEIKPLLADAYSIYGILVDTIAIEKS